MPSESPSDAVLDRLQTFLAPDFRLLRPLGQGSVARVYLAVETALERLVAIKVLRPELSGDDVTRRRFAREARSTARIAHPNVAAVYRVGELPDGGPFIVMEYVDGRTLADVLLADGPMEAMAGRRALAQIAAALAAAHAEGVIHRDIRPNNILVERGTSRFVLTDFGLAGIVESGRGRVTRITRTREILGDPRYASPEQLLGEPTTLETDVYSFGVVGYELLTGAGPYEARRLTDLVAAHVSGTPRPLLELRPDADPELARLLERSLAKQPAHRPTAAELAAALTTSPTPAPAEEPEPATPLPTFLRELQRRRVYRTAVAYGAAGFAILQGADLVLQALPQLPGWSYRALAVAVLAGFPVALVLAWGFQITRVGIQRTHTHPAIEAAAGGRAVYFGLRAAALAASLLVAALVGWRLLR